ncbi:MAG TPA: M10 family metallopeptidase C-terminal domain-containing protein, partial [Burkholderiaceae bacterium]|nr:M10 family metallopeptidase C-terminal domain-containing protein [Burkholderiaceae bacterium]
MTQQLESLGENSPNAPFYSDSNNSAPAADPFAQEIQALQLDTDSLTATLADALAKSSPSTIDVPSVAISYTSANTFAGSGGYLDTTLATSTGHGAFSFTDLVARAQSADVGVGSTSSDGDSQGSSAANWGCNCPLCSGTYNPDAVASQATYGSSSLNQDDQGFTIDVSNPASGLVGTTMANGLPIFSAYETAAQIARPGNTWVTIKPSLEITYSFEASGITSAAFAPFDEQYKTVTREIFRQYADITGLTFREVTGSTVPNIQFQGIIGQEGGGGWSGYPSSSIVYTAIGYPLTAGDVFSDSYVYNTIIHEIGHAMGLAHPGNYNGSNSYPADSVYWNDSRQYSVMSYNGGSITGASYDGSPATPMLHDMLALQMEYGINWSTRSGNTTYGFNSNTGLDSYTFTANDKTAIFTIWDGGGNDTLDFSGFSTNTVMDLRQGGFSSSGLETYNVAVAYNAVIENAIGGSGNDKIRGNEVGNALAGGYGNDTLYGGYETPVSTATNPHDFLGVQLNEAPTVRNQYLSLTGEQALSGSAFSIEMLVDLTRSAPSVTPFLSYAVSGSDNELLLEGNNNGYLDLSIDGLTAYTTPILLRSLIDGDPHRLSVTWDSTTGNVAFYVDGVLKHSGVYTAAIGHTLSPGGSLVIGQEQDALGGSFDSSQILSGRVGDIRIFNDVRTAQEIATNAFTTLSGSEQGLVHNWQVQDGNTTKLVDVATANPAVELTSLLPLGSFTASQSSSNGANSGTERVIDNSDGTYNHTLNSGNEWLKVDFTQPMEVSYLEIVNRPGQLARLNGATISVLDDHGNVLYTSAPVTGSPSVLTVMLPSPMTASAVRIDQDTNYLHICELNIYGTPPAGTTVAPALLNTDLTIQNGATLVSTAPVIDTTPDNDTLTGGAGSDVLYGGAGNDTLIGDGGAPGFAATYGLSLNSAGGNSQSLRLNGATGLPTTAFSLEFVLDSSAVTTYQTFATLPGVSVQLDGSNLWYAINGSYKWSGISVGELGSDPHRVAFTWNSADGSYACYMDGALQNSGNGFQAGYTLPSSGNIVFNPNKGSLGDIRLYDHVLTAAEVSTNNLGPLTDPANTNGLVLNWVVGANGTVSDAKGGTAPQVVVGSGATPTGALLLAATQSDDTLVGGLGNDSLNGGTGNDLLNGGAGADTLEGGAGNDLLQGEAGDNWLSGGTGDDSLAGGADRDWLQGGAGADTIDGGGGHGHALYSSSSSAVTVNLATGQCSGGDAAGDVLLNITAVDGSAFNDSLTGNAGANWLGGGTGNDTLNGGSGIDTLIGGRGDDSFYVDNAADVVTEQSGEGADTAYASADYVLAANVENLVLQGSVARGTGNALNNVITGNASGNTIDGGAGNDTISGGSGDNWLSGGTGDDSLAGGA